MSIVFGQARPDDLNMHVHFVWAWDWPDNVDDLVSLVQNVPPGHFGHPCPFCPGSPGRTGRTSMSIMSGRDQPDSVSMHVHFAWDRPDNVDSLVIF